MPYAVDICLATYNGARFLEAQLASLWSQSDQDFRILARDDGSTDGTQAILAAHAAAKSERFVVITTPSIGGGARGNFGALLSASTAPYVACCDQDDVWESDHISILRRAMSALEGIHGPAVPLLVHSDLRVVDGELKELCPSLWRYQHLDPKRTRLAPLLVQNVVTGCAMLVNRACVAKSLPIPIDCMMHDWWMTLVCAAFGALAATPEPTVRYRQHGGNTLGAQAHGTSEVWKRVFTLRLPRMSVRVKIEANLAQGRAFAQRYSTDLSTRAGCSVADFSGLATSGWFRRRYVVLRHGFWKIGLARNLVWLAKI